MKDKSGKSVWVIVTAVIVAILVLYPMSLGPAAWFASKTGVAYKDVFPSRGLWIYWPLGWCGETWGWDGTIGTTLDWYIRLFLPDSSSVGLPTVPDVRSFNCRPIVKG